MDRQLQLYWTTCRVSTAYSHFSTHNTFTFDPILICPLHPPTFCGPIAILQASIKPGEEIGFLLQPGAIERFTSTTMFVDNRWGKSKDNF